MKFEEKRKHSSLIKPYSYYESYIPDYFPNVSMHCHGEFEVNYVRSGLAEFICDDERFISHAGDIIIIPPNMLHAINQLDDMHQLYDTFVFSTDMLGVLERDRCAEEYIRPIIDGKCEVKTHITTDNICYTAIQSVIENIISNAKKDSALDDIVLKSELLRLIWLLWESKSVRIKDTETESRSELMRPAFNYIDEHINEDITIGEVADVIHLSQSYFMARFRETTGMGMVEYVNRIRIKNVCDMLRHTSKTISEIAYSNGFRNISNFNRQFLKCVGCAPNEFRKKDRIKIMV